MRRAAAASIELPLDPQDAWDAVMDWDRQTEWMLLTTVRAVSPDRVSARTNVGPIGFTDDMVITQWSPPYECRVRHLGRVVRGDGIFRLEPSERGTRFTWIEDGVPRVLRHGFELFMRMSLRRLGREIGWT